MITGVPVGYHSSPGPIVAAAIAGPSDCSGAPGGRFRVGFKGNKRSGFKTGKSEGGRAGRGVVCGLLRCFRAWRAPVGLAAIHGCRFFARIDVENEP